MRLTWKDAVATMCMAAIVAVYVALLQGAGWPLVASVRGTTAAILIIGAVGGCAMGAASELYGKIQTPALRMFVVIASILGVGALVSGVIALVTASELALAVVFAATAALWLMATLRHVFTPRTPPIGGRDVHEVIDPYQVAPK
ncbi:MAG TPA: hypothetical protein VF892_04180 [Pseudonocardiaceae bacterium]